MVSRIFSIYKTIIRKPRSYFVDFTRGRCSSTACFSSPSESVEIWDRRKTFTDLGLAALSFSTVSARLPRFTTAGFTFTSSMIQPFSFFFAGGFGFPLRAALDAFIIDAARWLTRRGVCWLACCSDAAPASFLLTYHLLGTVLFWFAYAGKRSVYCKHAHLQQIVYSNWPLDTSSLQNFKKIIRRYTFLLLELKVRLLGQDADA